MPSLYLVDDHAVVRDGLAAALQAAGHPVLGGSHDPDLAWADLARLRPELLLLDLNLQQRSGFELLERLQTLPRGQAPGVIVLTMSPHARHADEALRAGARGYVLKGEPMSELLAAIAAVARGQRHLSQQAAALLQAAPFAEPLDELEAVRSLSVRERQVVRLVVEGLPSVEIARRLFLSPKTVDSYRSRLMAKLGVSNVAALVRLAVRCGLVDDAG